ncbi:Leukotoxin [Acaryochloris thomasi RCC1774]|uniref:Leukotoxin n=1 Tax=Acaryochloris thomasi RCC1774 TaxID=1764569 RepID=A0A2W1JIV6_9CYAN|nr:FG-GAP repeat protein [Acaryochloris thomasi]PZD73399.1 Leukotoxin [Acaryochloris thomasi RCC1774]
MITVSLSNLNGENGFVVRRITFPDPSEGVGSSVSGAGDINGDGFDDLILGPDSGMYKYGETKVYVIYGSSENTSGSLGLADLNGNNGFIIESANPNSTSIRPSSFGSEYSIETGTADSNAGFSVSGLGDINGDGIDDFIIGAPRRPLKIPFSPPTPVGSGQGYVVFGRSEGFSKNFSLAELDGETGFVIESDTTGSLTGQSVSNVGDFNGDGLDDIIIGAPGLDPAGTSYLIFGSDKGFDKSLALSDLNGSNGFALSGSSIGDQTGTAVSGAGDVNGDGFDDLIVAAPNGSNAAGITYVLFGTNTTPRSINVDSLNGNNGFAIFGEETYDISGLSVSDIDDFNGDGFDDLIIGTGSGTNGVGVSHVIFGQADGFPAALNVNEIDGRNGFSIVGEERTGAGRSVSGAGDINGDGLGDVIVGAPDTNYLAGASYVLFGQQDSVEPAVDLANLSPSQGFLIPGDENFSRGSNSYAYIGDAVSGAGDINGDGIDDLVIGSRGGFIIGTGSAQSYVVFGNAPPELDLNSKQDGLNSTATFTQGAISLARPGSIAVTDANTSTLRSATISITNPLDNESEILAANVNDTEITATYDSATSTLTLTGKDTLENYQRVLATITYNNTADSPDPTDRSIQFVINDGADFSNESAMADGRSETIATTAITFELLNRIDGTSDPDTLFGSREADRIIGFGGNDFISGRSGNDVLAGRSGNDQIFGNNGNDSLNGNRGNDLLNGGSGDDLLRAGQGKDKLFGSRGDDILRGNQGNDILLGGSGNDSLNGGKGLDLLYGSSGDDSLKGGSGGDRLFGGVGDDTLRGGNGIDLLQGSQGHDRLDGGFGSDSLFGGAGSDQFVLRAGDGNDIIFDYQDDIDSFALDGLDLADLEIHQGLGQTTVRVRETQETLATLLNIQASIVEDTDFTIST